MNEFETALKKDVEKYLEYLGEYKAYTEPKIKEIMDRFENVRKAYIIENNIEEGDFESGRRWVATMLCDNNACKEYEKLSKVLQESSFFQIKSKNQTGQYVSLLTPCFYNYYYDLECSEDLDDEDNDGYYKNFNVLPKLFFLITEGMLFPDVESNSLCEDIEDICNIDYQNIKIKRKIDKLYCEEQLPGITKYLMEPDFKLKHVIDDEPIGCDEFDFCQYDDYISKKEEYENEENVFAAVDLSLEFADYTPNYSIEAEEWYFFTLKEDVLLFILEKISEEKDLSLLDMAIEIAIKFDKEKSDLRRLLAY